MTTQLDFPPAQGIDQVIAPPPAQAFPYQAALYFLDGHYLFQKKQGDALTSKFVTAADVSAAFSRVETDSGWLPEGVRRTGTSPRGNWFLYTQPAQVIAVQLGPNEPFASVPIPRTCMMGVGATYYLWALSKDEFDPAATAYRAPFPNLHDDGQVCWGMNKPPAASPEIAPAAWKLFFDTPFNGDLAGGKSKKHKNDVREALRKSAARYAYPTSDLVSLEAPLAAMVESMIRRKG